jgi:ankyrin repeat protein
MTDFENLIEAAKLGKTEEVRALIQHRLELINQRDTSGATPLHYAAFGGHREVVRLLVVHGADVNARDAQFGATPAGWAIEYLRELGAFLGIELTDFAYAIHTQNIEWTARFLKRFPALRLASDENGSPFKLLAAQTANPELIRLFDAPPDTARK